MFIEFNNVSKEIKKRKLLNNVNFQVSEQSIIALEGINGSGKTLILEALLGLIKVSGTIKINGNIVDTTKPFPIKAGIMIENPSIIEEFNAYQNLDLLRQLDPEVHTEKITELLTYFELNKFPKQKTKHFSLGMKQKLGIAQALLGQYPLIILDVPTNALDADSLTKLKEKIINYQSKGTTFIIASHDHEFLKSIATKHLIVNDGRVSEL